MISSAAHMIASWSGSNSVSILIFSADVDDAAAAGMEVFLELFCPRIFFRADVVDFFSFNFCLGASLLELEG